MKQLHTQAQAATFFEQFNKNKSEPQTNVAADNCRTPPSREQTGGGQDRGTGRGRRHCPKFEYGLDKSCVRHAANDLAILHTQKPHASTAKGGTAAEANGQTVGLTVGQTGRRTGRRTDTQANELL